MLNRQIGVVIYLSTPGGMTGAPRRILTLCAAIQRHGVTPYVVADSTTELYVEARRLGLQTIALQTQAVLKERNKQLLRGGLLRKAWIAANLVLHNLSFFFAVRRVAPDLLLFRASKTFAFAGVGALMLRRPVVWDVDYETPSAGLVGRLQRFALGMSKCAFMQYPGAQDKIFDADTIRANEKKFSALIPGIRLESLDTYAALRSAIDGGSGAVYRILHVGTVCDRKNQLLSLLALIDLRERYPEIWASRHVVVSFAGAVHEAEYKEMLDDCISTNRLEGHVEFLGWQDNVPALMASSNLLVLPSKDEGVPNTIQEAMYIGCPVAVGNAGGMPSVVEHGRSGWVLPVQDPAPWAELFARLLSDDTNACEVTDCARDFALRFFDDETWARDYAEALARVAHGE